MHRSAPQYPVISPFGPTHTAAPSPHSSNQASPQGQIVPSYSFFSCSKAFFFLASSIEISVMPSSVAPPDLNTQGDVQQKALVP